MKTKIFFAILVLFFVVVLLFFLRDEKEVIVVDGDTTTVKIYFANTSTDPAFLDCSQVSSVERVVTSTLGIEQVVLEELLRGPLVFESKAGYFTSINPGVKVLGLSIVDGVAEADFSKRLEEAVGGSCRVTSIRSQIENTLKQFSNIKDVIIKVEGNSEAVLQP